LKRSLLLILPLWLALGAFFSISFVSDLENRTYDAKARFCARRLSDAAVLVEIDQPSLDFYHRRFNLPYPWPRSLYGRALRFLHRAGARLIALDMIFSEPSAYADEDQHLADAVAESGNVCLPIFFNRGANEHPDLKRFALRDAPDLKTAERKGVLTPIAPLLTAMSTTGNAEDFPDRDGQFRRLTHFVRFDGRTFPSFSLAMALALKSEMRLGTIPFAGNGTLNLRFYRRDSFRRLSIADLIQSEVRLEEGLAPTVDANDFKDRLVLIGATAPGLRDLRPNPMSPTAAGVELHATALLNLLRGEFIREAPVWLDRTAWLLAMLLLGLLLRRIRSTLLQVTVSAAALLLAVAANVALFAAGVDFSLLPLLAGLTLTAGADVYVRYRRVRKEKRFIQSAFQNYLSDSLLKQILKNPSALTLGGEKKTVTVFFSDLAGFTSFSERLEPEAVVHVLNRYLERMTGVILEHGGFVNKFEGDAVMAFWGAPLADVNQSQRALRAALACLDELADLNHEFKRSGQPALQMRIGINSGPAIVGNIGSSKRFEYTVIGDTVNLASRLEGINKMYSTRIICGTATRRLGSEGVLLRRLDRVRVKGKAKPEEIFEVLTTAEPADERAHERVRRFEEALDLYFQGRFRRAGGLFAALADDPPARVFAERCRRLASRKPPDWDGTWTFTEK